MIRRDARLLVVDDEPLSRVATHHALRALGCRVIDEASEGAIAMQLLASERYDLVISNWRMASMSGRDLLKLIRGTPRLSGVPVVVATPVTPKIVAEAADAGVSAFLPRPFGFNTLEEILKIFLSKPAALKPERVFVS
jgi:two-component system, chemotaxis family, chemotaxis protein CheY